MKEFFPASRHRANNVIVLQIIAFYIEFVNKSVKGRKTVLLGVEEVLNLQNSYLPPLRVVYRFLIKRIKLIIPNNLSKDVLSVPWNVSY